MTAPQIFEGLAGILVAKTELSSVEGDSGRLSVRGRSLEALVSQVPFEAMLVLLLEGALPEPARRAHFQALLGDARVRAHLQRVVDEVDEQFDDDRPPRVSGRHVSGRVVAALILFVLVAGPLAQVLRWY